LNKTNFLILACILVSLLFWVANQSGVDVEQFAFSTENLLAGRVWTPITALFIHADVLHLAGNMIFLYVFGNMLGVFFYAPSTFIVGASGAIFTLTAVVMLVKPLKFSFLFFMPVGLVAVLYFVYNVLAVQFGLEGNVAYVSHIIGFAIGIPFGLLWGKNMLKNILITLVLFIVYLIIILLIIPYVLQLLW
jgi:membrane associated rhomboid family serine protease